MRWNTKLIVLFCLLVFHNFAHLSVADPQECETLCYNPKPSLNVGDHFSWKVYDLQSELVDQNGNQARVLGYELEILTSLEGVEENLVRIFPTNYFKLELRFRNSGGGINLQPVNMFSGGFPGLFLYPTSIATSDAGVLNYFDYRVGIGADEEGEMANSDYSSQYSIQRTIENGNYIEIQYTHEIFHQRPEDPLEHDMIQTTIVDKDTGLLSKFEFQDFSSEEELVYHLSISLVPGDSTLDFGILTEPYVIGLIVIILIAIPTALIYKKLKDREHETITPTDQ